MVEARCVRLLAKAGDPAHWRCDRARRCRAANEVLIEIAAAP